MEMLGLRDRIAFLACPDKREPSTSGVLRNVQVGLHVVTFPGQQYAEMNTLVGYCATMLNSTAGTVHATLSYVYVHVAAFGLPVCKIVLQYTRDSCKAGFAV